MSRIDINIEEDRSDASSKEPKPIFASDERFDRLRSHFEIARRAHDRLPPLTTYRRGPLARLEIWLKRRVSKLTHWYVWEQINFNSAILQIINIIYELLSELKGDLTELQKLGDRLSKQVTATESSDSDKGLELRDELNRMRFDQGMLFEQLRDENRVHLKQISLEILELTSAISMLRERLSKLADEVEAIKARCPEGGEKR